MGRKRGVTPAAAEQWLVSEARLRQPKTSIADEGFEVEEAEDLGSCLPHPPIEERRQMSMRSCMVASLAAWA